MTGELPTAPTKGSRPGGGGSGRWLLAWRLARREVRRHPWRHALVVALIFVPVLVTFVAFSAVDTVEAITARKLEARKGGADLEISSWPRSFEWGSGEVVDDSFVAEPELTDPAEPDPAEAEPVSVEERRRRAQEEREQGAADLQAHLDADQAVVDHESWWWLGDWLVTGQQRTDGHGPVLVGAHVAMAPAGSAATARYHLDQGRLPAQPDEAFLTSSLAEAGGWVLGDRAELVGDGRTVTVVGIGRAIDDVDAAWLLTTGSPEVVVTDDLDIRTPDGDHASPAHLVTEVWTDGQQHYVEDGPEGLSQVGRWDEVPTTEAVSALLTLGAAILAGLVAIVASTAFAIGSRRQLRSVGLLATSGADASTIRAALVLQGAIPGLVAGLLALAVGALGATVARRAGWGELATGVLDAPIHLSPFGGLLAVGIGLGSGVVAAWHPARTASRLPVLSALAGRRPLGPVDTRVPVAGAALFLTGCTVIALWSGADPDSESTVVDFAPLLAVLALGLGALGLAPALIALLARVSGRLRGTGRIAVRGLARQRTQSAAAVTAIACCLALPVAVLAGDAIPSRQGPSNVVELGGEPIASATSLVPADALVVDAWGDEVRLSEVDEIQRELDEVLEDPTISATRWSYLQVGGDWIEVTLVDPAEVDGLLPEWAVARLAAGEAIPLGSFAPGTARLGVGGDVIELAVQPLPAEIDGMLQVHPQLQAPDQPGLLVAEHALPLPTSTDRPGAITFLRPSPASKPEVRALRTLTNHEEDAGVPTLEDVRATIEDPDRATIVDLRSVWFNVVSPDLYPPGPGETLWQTVVPALTLGASALALLVLTITLSLRAVDGEDDRRAALAAGAPPARLRRLRAIEGGLITALGAILAVPLGWAPVAAASLQRPVRPGTPIVERIPQPGWEVLLVVAFPVVLATIVWLVGPWLRSLVARRDVDQLLPRW